MIFIIVYKLLCNYFLNSFREKLQLEIAAREKAEKKHQEYEERLKQMQAEISKREQDLLSAQVLKLQLIMNKMNSVLNNYL